MTNPTLEAALGYARRGWPVVPLKARSKEPASAHGVKDATTSEGVIRGWFEDHPNWNVGIATGAPGPMVLDVDNPDHPDAPDIDDFTSVVLSGRGFHVYFAPDDQRTLGTHFGELRGKGSYVLAPPSVHPSGEPYRWVRPHRELVPVPDRFLDRARRPGAGEGPVPADYVSPGEMYDHLLDFAVRLARSGMVAPSARERALQAEFEARRAPGREYGGSPDDTRRLAHAPTDILEREREALLSPLKGGDAKVADEVADLAAKFRTPTELREGMPPEPDWIWDGHFARGFITLVGGRPKVGKSTIVYEAVDRLVRGDAEPFLGAALHPTDVVVVSEEHAVTALAKFRDTDRLHVLTREAAWPLPSWQMTLAAALSAAKTFSAGLVLVDSFTFWAGLASEQGQDAGAVQERFNDLVLLAREGLAVVLIHHQRKAGGEYGDALLGSTAFAANADTILEVERLDDTSPHNYRRVMRTGRWYVPPVLLAAWSRDTGYTLVAEADSIADADDLVWIEKLREALRPYGTAKRNTQLADELGADSRKWGRAMSELMADGEVIKAGAGTQKDPFTYTLVAPEDRPTQPEI